MGVGSFAENRIFFIVLLDLQALQLARLLVELTRELGLFSPPQLVGCLLPVVQEFGLEQAIDLLMGHKVVHLVIVGDRDPLVFSLHLALVQIVIKGGDMRFWIVTPCCEELGFDSQLHLGGNKIPRPELGEHCFYHLVLYPA